MTLALTEEHLALAESVRGWAGPTAPAPVVRSAVDAGDHGAALYRDTLRPGLAATLFAAEACGIAAWAVDTAASYA